MAVPGKDAEHRASALEVRERERRRRRRQGPSVGERWRRGRDSNPRCFRTPLFESGTINHSDTSPRERIPNAGPVDRAERGSASARGERREELLGLVAADPADDLDPARQGGCWASWMTVPAAPSRVLATAKTSASTSLSSSAPTHIAHGSWVAKIVASARRTVPSLRAASRRATTTAWAVGSLVSWTRSWARTTIASSTTATAAMGRSPRSSGEPGLGQRLAHEQLVVHGPMLADGPLADRRAGGSIRYRNATDRARSER